MRLEYFWARIIIVGTNDIFASSNGVALSNKRCEISGDYAEWKDEEIREAKCPSASYMFAFVYLIVYWLFLPLMCCSCCCGKCFGKKQTDVEAA